MFGGHRLRGFLTRQSLVCLIIVGIAAFGIAGVSNSAHAQTTATWADGANGQMFDCNGGAAGGEYSYPDNDNWSQQEVRGTDACGTPNAVLQPSNWSTPLYPNNGSGGVDYDVVLGAPGNTILDVSATIDTLTITNSGKLDVLAGKTLHLAGGGTLQNDSLITINSNFLAGAQTGIVFDEDTLIDGTGEIHLNRFNAAQLTAAAGKTVTIASTQEITGLGTITGSWINNGIIEGSSISLTQAVVTNNNEINAAQNGGISILNTNITQDPALGSLLAKMGGAINLTNSTITGGRLRYAPSTTTFTGYRASNATLVNVHNQARINVLFGTMLTIDASTFHNDGPITVNNDNLSLGTSIRFTDNVTINGSGEILLNQSGLAALLKVEGSGLLTQSASHTIRGGGRIDATRFTNHGTVDVIGIINSPVDNDGSMTRIGEINGDVLNQGTLAGTFAASSLQLNGTLTGTGPLGFIQINGTHAPGSSPAAITVSGQYAVGPNGTLALEIGGHTPGTDFDQINVVPDAFMTANKAMLDGTLAVELIDNGSGPFSPQVGDTFQLITAGTVAGTFAHENLPKAAGGRGLTWQVQYNSTNVTLKLLSALTGDYNGNGVVDAPDYTIWRDTLNSTTNLAADGDGSGTVDVGDYNVWKSQFGMVVPGAGGGSVVTAPEPGGLLLFLTALSAFAVLHRK